MDISHGIPFASPMKIYAGDYDDVADAAIVVISAGAGQKPGETRLDLVNKNVAIFKSIIPEIAKRNFAGIMLVVANPVDILTQVAIKLSGLPENRVIGCSCRGRRDKTSNAWFVRLLQRDKRFEVNNVSTFFDNVGTDKYKRVYAEVSRKKKDSGKKPSNVMQVEEKCHYVGSGMVIR